MYLHCSCWCSSVTNMAISVGPTNSVSDFMNCMHAITKWAYCLDNEGLIRDFFGRLLLGEDNKGFFLIFNLIVVYFILLFLCYNFIYCIISFCYIFYNISFIFRNLFLSIIIYPILRRQEVPWIECPTLVESRPIGRKKHKNNGEHQDHEYGLVGRCECHAQIEEGWYSHGDGVEQDQFWTFRYAPAWEHKNTQKIKFPQLIIIAIIKDKNLTKIEKYVAYFPNLIFI